MGWWKTGPRKLSLSRRGEGDTEEHIVLPLLPLLSKPNLLDSPQNHIDAPGPQTTQDLLCQGVSKELPLVDLNILHLSFVVTKEALEHLQRSWICGSIGLNWGKFLINIVGRLWFSPRLTNYYFFLFIYREIRDKQCFISNFYRLM